jgi:hypothetical protein
MIVTRYFARPHTEISINLLIETPAALPGLLATPDMRR